MSERSLTGIRVIESATMLAAPLSGMILADHGADVIKIELPDGGDPMRLWGYRKDDVSLAFKFFGRNKRSVTIDLRTGEGKERFLKLIATADVYIENFRPGTLEKWGLGPDVLRKFKPDLILLRMSGFGQTGPKSKLPGFGTLAEAMSGFAYINGWPQTPPTLPSFGMADAIAGLAGAYGILAALRYRDRTGKGQDVDIALYEPLLTILGTNVIDFQQLGIVQERAGNITPFVAPRNVYETKDGKWIALACSTQSTTERLLDAIGKLWLIEDERFKDNASRMKNIAALDEHIIAWMKAHTYDDAMAELEKFGVTAGPVYSAAELFNDEHVRARGSIVPVQDAELGEVWMQAPIPRLTESPGTIEFAGRATPGADNDAVFSELGLKPEAAG